MKKCIAYLIVVAFLAFCSTLCGCANLGSMVREHARAEALQVANARADALAERVESKIRTQSDALAERVEGKIRTRVGEELQQRGIDPEKLKQDAREFAAANGIDLPAVREALREDVKQEGVALTTAVVKEVFDGKTTAEFKQDIVTDAAETGKQSALKEFAAKYGPTLAKAGGMKIAEAVGLSTPVGAGILGGLWMVGTAIRRRRGSEVEPVGGKTQPA